MRIGHGQATRLVVGSDHNQGVAMLFGIVQSDLDGIAEVNQLIDHISGVVRMTREVDLRAFHHEEETVFSAVEGL